jgi:hypothetical protein
VNSSPNCHLAVLACACRCQMRLGQAVSSWSASPEPFEAGARPPWSPSMPAVGRRVYGWRIGGQKPVSSVSAMRTLFQLDEHFPLLWIFFIQRELILWTHKQSFQPCEQFLNWTNTWTSSWTLLKVDEHFLNSRTFFKFMNVSKYMNVFQICEQYLNLCYLLIPKLFILWLSVPIY